MRKQKLAGKDHDDKKNFRNLNGERKDSSDDLVAVTGRDREREGEREREKETDRDRERNRQR